jgi:hypothetical protein
MFGRDEVSWMELLVVCADDVWEIGMGDVLGAIDSSIIDLRLFVLMCTSYP